MPPEACETSGGGSTGGRPARGHETAKVLRVLSQAPGFIRKATSRPTCMFVVPVLTGGLASRLPTQALALEPLAGASG